ncbi:MAG TPA: hypothetical protein VFE54_08455 [Mucilaginibacter sp.]|nr:hypothetical protein [Mucilaginibacter sp.]
MQRLNLFALLKRYGAFLGRSPTDVKWPFASQHHTPAIAVKRKNALNGSDDISFVRIAITRSNSPNPKRTLRMKCQFVKSRCLIVFIASFMKILSADSIS